MEKSLDLLRSQIDQIFILEESKNSDVAKRIMSFFPQRQWQIVSDDPFQDHRGALSAREFNKSKKQIVVKKFLGHFFKRCPGSSQKKVLNCCNYFILNLGQQCNMNCSYCYLQSYLNSPAMHVYSNIEDALNELRVMAESHKDFPIRVGTGEVIDSLSLDPLTGYTEKLIHFFKEYPRWTLELKTKSNLVDQFLNVEHANNIVVSWSINAEEIINKEEHGTASLKMRLDAADKCLTKGFKVAFHIDPLIYYPEWQYGYGQLIGELKSRFQPEQINVISIGALRFQPEQRHMMRDRFGMQSFVTKAEMFASEGNKLRYDRKLRNEMFDFVLNKFK